jgi:hypothetical protein
MLAVGQAALAQAGEDAMVADTIVRGRCVVEPPTAHLPARRQQPRQATSGRLRAKLNHIDHNGHGGPP